MSYSTLFENKQLIIFPVISTAAAIFVLMSFLLPLEFTGQLDAWLARGTEGGVNGEEEIWMYVTTFLFYFCNYFVIVFFNTALIAAVMDILEGREGRVGKALGFATSRIHAIFGWALVSAVVGMILKAIERNQKAGQWISAILGSAWTGLTYFVIPVIVSDGVGPVEAFKRSMRTLKSTWGTALTGNFSLGLFSLLLILPVIGVGVLLFMYAGPAVAISASVPLLLVVIAVTSTADAVFKAYLYAYATGKTLPASVDTYAMRDAFRSK